MNLNTGHIFGIIAAFQSLFLAFLILSRNNKSASDKILSIIFFFFALMLFDTMATSREIMPQLPGLMRIIIVFSNTPFIIAPLIYLLTQTILSSEYRLSNKTIYHFIPAFLVFAFSVYYWYPQAKVQLISMNNLYKVVKIFALVQNLGYLLAIISILVSSQNIKAFKLNWKKQSKSHLLVYICAIFVMFWLIDLGCLVLYDFYKDASFCAYSRSLFYTSGFIAFNLMLYWSVLFPNAFAQKNKYIQSSLNINDKQNYLQKLKDYIIIEKPYLDPEINLTKLSAYLNISSKHLSQIINEHYNKSFNEYINHHRINDFIQQIENPNKLENKYFADIYYSVGFNSKSAFYAAFKKATGTTPQKYQESFVTNNFLS